MDFRMVCVGGFSFLDEHWETPDVRRLAVPVNSCAQDLSARVAAGVETAKRHQPGLTAWSVENGTPEM